MKLSFEEWVLQKQFNYNISKLFEEVFICYKNGAYRASMMFSYIAFLTILKELIIKSTKPTTINDDRWSKIVRNLQDDNLWEKEVFDELINSSSPIFNINGDIRQQIKYWKDRRNDCAHFKANDIEGHHVESFWSFVRSNLSKVTIEGGKESLLNKFERHFDATFTPPSADFGHLVNEIDSAIETSELMGFWSGLIEKIDRYAFVTESESKATKVFNLALVRCGERTIESLIQYLRREEHDLVFISIYPNRLNSFNYSPSEIRKIWKSRIWSIKPSAFTVYGALLRNSLIPVSEIEEALTLLIEKAHNYRPNDEATHLALSGHGFGDLLFSKAIVADRLNDWYRWVNPRVDMIAYYVGMYPLKSETVEVICEMYTRARYSHWLDDRLKTLFEENESKKDEFHTIATSQGFKVPESLE